jgi:ABC-type phosphate transport system permease subunit
VQKAGIFVMVILCGIPALELNGFGNNIHFTLPTALACATVGGAAGGLLMCHRPLLAGLIGGLLAGPIGLLAVYFYTLYRTKVFNIELVIVQIIASVPGLVVGLWLKRILSDPSAENEEQFRTSGTK